MAHSILGGKFQRPLVARHGTHFVALGYGPEYIWSGTYCEGHGNVVFRKLLYRLRKPNFVAHSQSWTSCLRKRPRRKEDFEEPLQNMHAHFVIVTGTMYLEYGKRAAAYWYPYLMFSFLAEHKVSTDTARSCLKTPQETTNAAAASALIA